ncbi:hypothetical protein BC834DRAFT_157398 [Gloeopeniophorella convolvens]|nr:hypothetical protein BC834DRAFT_157398 [Gloeopeniophorella convolvens]
MMLYHKWFVHGMSKTAEESARLLSTQLYRRALVWTLESLEGDNELEPFFEGIPDLCSSKLVPNPLAAFIKPNVKLLSHALINLMDRTFSSKLVSEETMERRVHICIRALDAASPLATWRIFERVLFGQWQHFTELVEFGITAQKQSNNVNADPITVFYARCVVAVITVRAPDRDIRWSNMVMDQLDVDEAHLQRYLAHGDSVLLANLNHIITEMISADSRLRRLNYRTSIPAVSRETLQVACRLDPTHAFPALRNEFCSLWNRLVYTAQRQGSHDVERRFSILILREIRRVYLALHAGTDAAPREFAAATDERDPALWRGTSYPLCTLPMHRRLALVLPGPIGANVSAASSPARSMPGSPRTRHVRAQTLPAAAFDVSTAAWRGAGAAAAHRHAGTDPLDAQHGTPPHPTSPLAAFLFPHSHTTSPTPSVSRFDVAADAVDQDANDEGQDGGGPAAAALAPRRDQNFLLAASVDTVEPEEEQPSPSQESAGSRITSPQFIEEV